MDRIQIINQHIKWGKKKRTLFVLRVLIYMSKLSKDKSAPQSSLNKIKSLNFFLAFKQHKSSSEVNSIIKC